MHAILNIFDFFTSIIWDIIKLFVGLVIVIGILWVLHWVGRAYREMPWNRKGQ